MGSENRTGQRVVRCTSPAAAGSARDTANMSPDGRGGTGYVLKK